jgi:hypothetical protein
MSEVPCSQRTFPLVLKPLFNRVLSGYAFWWKHLTERIGRDEAVAVWQAAFQRYELPLLESILASGWVPVEPPESGPSCGDGEPTVVAADTTSGESERLPDPETVAMTGEAPPIRQIRSRFADLNAQRETTAYEALHLYAHGPALLAEALLDRHGKEGELIAYDILRARTAASAPPGGVSVREFMERADKAMNPEPGTRDIFAAGLDAETVSASPTEHVSRVRHCEWARYFREKHPRVGYLVACSTDEVFARASNTALRLQRTSTLMEGGEFCDFRYYAVQEESES